MAQRSRFVNGRPGMIRIDRRLVDLGLFESRAAARAAIEAGGVVADGATVRKPSQLVSETASIEAKPAHPYVSRGGLKLAHALNVLDLEPSGRVCLDIGVSTGGFSDVLLQRGAARVTAVDVGRGQLHPGVAQDPRLVSLEATDARSLTVDQISPAPDLIVCDASFIGLEKVLPAALALSAPGADLVALFKPQFQVGPDHVGKGGLVKDAAAISRAAARFEAWCDAQGWPIAAWTDSPILGGDGNAERLVHARRAPIG